ncbi:MAG: LptF/LptG family permease [Elusimicrobiota bacterium]|jgi:lipopolysaccharide export LptBFGC system permease protein LptF
MPILSRYLLRSYLPAFGATLGVFLFILLMQYFLRLFNLALLKGIPLFWILSCFMRLLPYFMSIALPVSFLTALMLTLGQLTETGEIMAMRASGFSFREILAPLFAAAALLSLLLLGINHYGSPAGFHSFREAYTQASSRLTRVELESKTYFTLGDWRFYAEEVASDGVLSGVKLVKTRGQYQRMRILAKEGRAKVQPGGLALELRSGVLQWPNEDPQNVTVAGFGRYRLFVPFVDQSKTERPLDIQEMRTSFLRERIRSGKLEASRVREYATEAALRSAGALAPLAVFWVACPLGLLFPRRGRAWAFGSSLLLMFAYYGLLALGVGIGRRQDAFSSFAPWLPNIASLIAGLPLWRRLLRL